MGEAACADGRKKQTKWLYEGKQDVSGDGFITVPGDDCQHHWAVR